jgi:hypothetical protein
VSAKPERSRIRLAGDPPMLAYFPDDNAYRVEGEWFWVRGRSRADIILRAPAVDDALGTGRPIRLQRLTVEIENGAKPNVVTIRTNGEDARVPLTPGEQKTVVVKPGAGLPYRPLTFPTNYLYSISIASENGFVPFLESTESNDSRMLGARIHLVPTYDRGL